MKFAFGTKSQVCSWSSRLALACLGTVLILPVVHAQSTGPSRQENAYHQASAIPTDMVSPLAGGPAAAQGGEYVDVYGNSIVMPASYCPEGCYGGAGYCGIDGGAYGDPMAIDFGGYTQDQIGPHYFDVAFGAVFLKSNDLATGIAPLAAQNAGGNRLLKPSDFTSDYEPGWQIAFRYDLGPLSVFEAAYMGLYDFAFDQSVNSTALNGVPNQLQTVWSNYGVPTPIDGLDDGETYNLTYKSDLQSSELSYRRYWVGNSSRVTGTYLLGFRYVRMTEQMDFDAQALLGESSLRWAGSNDLLGFQIGGDGWFGLRQGMRIGAEGKAGIYNNRFDFTSQGVFADVPSAPDDYNVGATGDQVAFIGEAGINLVIDILPSWSLRGGYQFLYIDNMATVASNVDTNTFVPAVLQAKDDTLYHGFNATAEYIW